MNKEIPCSQFLVSATNNQGNDLRIKFTEAARLYLETKGKNGGVIFNTRSFLKSLPGKKAVLAGLTTKGTD